MPDDDNIDIARVTLPFGGMPGTSSQVKASVDPGATANWTPVPGNASDTSVDPLATRDSGPPETLNADGTAPTTEGDANGKSRTIGPYQLLQQIGEGGMGSGWMAQQSEPAAPRSNPTRCERKRSSKCWSAFAKRKPRDRVRG